MAFLKVFFFVLALATLTQASIQASPDVDKRPDLFGRRFVVVNLVPPPLPERPMAQQQENFDYYDAVARGLDNQEGEPKKIDGETGSVVSDPDYENMPVLKVSQKHLETKKLLNANPFNVQTPEEPVDVEPATETVDFETSGQEPESHLIDGETGPPGIEPPREELSRPPVATRFTV